MRFGGAVLDLAGGAYSVLPDSLAGLRAEEKRGTGEKEEKDTGGERRAGEGTGENDFVPVVEIH